MADNSSRGRAADRKRLNKSEPYEMAYARSDRASPARKALLAKSGDGAAKKRASGSAKKSTAAGKKSNSGARKSTASSGARKSTSGSSTRKSTASSGARKSSSAGGKTSSAKRSGAKSASPAMKRTNAAPGRAPTPTTRGNPHPPKEEKTVENTAPKTMREPDAVDLLTDDHLAVSALFKRYEKLSKKDAPADERRSLAQSICDMLKAHTEIEEEIFYPAARKAGIDADMVDEANVEHASAKDLIAQIEGGNPEDDLYDAKVTVLGEYIQHHVVEEHTEMFPKCRRTGMDLVGLRSELESRKMAIAPAERESAANGTSDASGSERQSPGLFAKLSDKLFSSDSGDAAKSDRGAASNG